MVLEPVLIDKAKHFFFALSLSSIRMIVFFQVFPVLGSGLFQGLIRNAMFLSLSLALIPVVYPTIPTQHPGLLIISSIYLKEALLGMLMGFLASVPFWASESVGFFIDNQRGASMASIMDPMSGDQTSPMGLFIENAVVAIFFVSGMFMLMIGMIYESYSLWPVFEFFPKIDQAIFPLTFLQLLDTIFRLTFLYAAPVIIVLFFSEFGLGLANRFAPQLNVFVLAFPIKSGAACFLLIFYLSFLLNYLELELQKIPLVVKFLNRLLT